MKKYGSIEQFRNVIRKVKETHDYKGKDEQGNPIYSHDSNYPTLNFKGTVKLHGTNAGIVRYKDGRTEFQSRERVLSLEQDNSNFMQEMIKLDFEYLFRDIEFNDFVAVYGEWCGGNIQKGVAINGLDKMFVVFGVMVDDEWKSLEEVKSQIEQYYRGLNIYHIEQFQTYSIDIDFNSPENSQNRLIEMTIAVENECPVGKYFGNSGVGEGLVFTCVEDLSLKFKSKGEKHSVSKVKKLNSVDTESLENTKQFVDYCVTENRLEQGYKYLKEMSIPLESKSTGDFLKWIVGDVLKEEKDTLENSGLDEKLVKNQIVNKARQWFLNKL